MKSSTKGIRRNKRYWTKVLSNCLKQHYMLIKLECFEKNVDAPVGKEGSS